MAGQDQSRRRTMARRTLTVSWDRRSGEAVAFCIAPFSGRIPSNVTQNRVRRPDLISPGLPGHILTGADQ